jgi:membrane-associated phospholipid phosphatase
MATSTSLSREEARHIRLLALSAPATMAAFVVFFLLSLRDWARPPMPWDAWLSRNIRSLNIGGLQPVMKLISWPGWPPQNWILTTVTAFILHKRGFKVAPWIILAVLPIELGVAGMKRVINRTRPTAVPNVRFWPTDPSFPSGHTVQYTVFFGFLAHLLHFNVQNSWGRRISEGMCAALVILIGPSRVFLGHHWPTDVLAGYSLGLGLLFSFIQFYELLRLKVASPPSSLPLSKTEIPA